MSDPGDPACPARLMAVYNVNNQRHWEIAKGNRFKLKAQMDKYMSDSSTEEFILISEVRNYINNLNE